MTYQDITTQPTTDYAISCTGDAVTGDRVRFTEAVFGGSHRRPKFLGTRTIEAEIATDSYGQDKQQHTFSLTVLAAEGLDAPKAGAKIRRKGRNVYRNGTYRAAWDNEQDRRTALDEKHGRGDAARAQRAERKQEAF